MKIKNLIVYTSAAIILIVGSFLLYKYVSNKEEFSNLISIGVKDLETKVNNKDKFILVITQTGCSHCEQYLPELNRTLQEVNYKVYSLNITNLNGTEQTTLNKYVKFSGTPTTIFFNEGKETTTLNRIIGYAGKDKIKDKLKSLGYID